MVFPTSRLLPRAAQACSTLALNCRFSSAAKNKRAQSGRLRPFRSHRPEPNLSGHAAALGRKPSTSTSTKVKAVRSIHQTQGNSPLSDTIAGQSNQRVQSFRRPSLKRRIRHIGAGRRESSDQEPSLQDLITEKLRPTYHAIVRKINESSRTKVKHL